jgi:hypothetical protein
MRRDDLGLIRWKRAQVAFSDCNVVWLHACCLRRGRLGRYIRAFPGLFVPHVTHTIFRKSRKSMTVL